MLGCALAWGEAFAVMVEATKADVARIAPVALVAAVVDGGWRASAAAMMVISVSSMLCAGRRLLAG